MTRLPVGSWRKGTRLNPLLIRSFLQIRNSSLIEWDNQSLNPLLIRSFLQIHEDFETLKDAKGLNPLLIRSFLQIGFSQRGQWSLVGLNPLLIRSFLQITFSFRPLFPQPVRVVVRVQLQPRRSHLIPNAPEGFERVIRQRLS